MAEMSNGTSPRACAHFVEEVGEVVEELREMVDQHRPVEPARRRKAAHCRQPVGEDRLAMRSQKVR